MFRRCAIAVAAALAVGAPARAGLLLAPGQLVGGMSQSDLSGVWWQTMIQDPVAGKLLVSKTGGAVTDPSQNSVVFLTGIGGQLFSSVSGSISGTVNLNAGQTLFFPILNSTSWTPGNTLYGNTLAGVRRDSAAGLGFATAGVSDINTQATLNLVLTEGKTTLISEGTADLLNYRERSLGFFNLDIPADNVIGLPAGSVQAISDGWYVAIGPLAPGTYTLTFGGSTTGTGVYYETTNDQAVSYTLNVGPAPEPSTLLLAGAAGLVVLGRKAWKRGTKRAAVIS